MNWDWPMEIALGAGALLFVISLVTGKTLNPVWWGNPMIVNRREHPDRYWSAIFILSLFAISTAWVAYDVVTGAPLN